MEADCNSQSTTDDAPEKAHVQYVCVAVKDDLRKTEVRHIEEPPIIKTHRQQCSKTKRVSFKIYVKKVMYYG